MKGRRHLRSFPAAVDLFAVPVDRYGTLAYRVGLYRGRTPDVATAVWMVAHVHDHDVVGLGNRTAVAVGISGPIPAHGVSSRGISEVEGVVPHPHLDRLGGW